MNSPMRSTPIGKEPTIKSAEPVLSTPQDLSLTAKTGEVFFNPLQRNSPPLPPEAGAAETVGNLSLVGRGKQFRAHFAAAQRNDLVIHLAYLGTDLNNNIRRGKNAGRTLEHDFVVLAHTQMPLGADGDAVLPRAEIKHATAIAAWVSTRSDPAPIQAVGGWLAVH